MKILYSFLLLLFFASKANSQDRYSRISTLYTYVQEADSLADKSQFTFYLDKIGKDFTGRKETWHYTLKNGRVVVFQVKYYIQNIEFNEVYYVMGEQLVCSEEYETRILPDDDRISFAGIYYFDRTNILHRVNLGTKTSFQGEWNIGYDALDRFRTRYAELKENLITRR